MRIWACVLLAWLALANLAGCKSKARQMSEYPYFVKTLDQRWEIARKSFQSDKPDISYAPVLLKDLTGTIEAMRGTYFGPNRDRAIAELEEITRQFRSDLSTQVDMRFGTVTLLPQATAKDVGQSVEKAYQVYLKFRTLVETPATG